MVRPRASKLQRQGWIGTTPLSILTSTCMSSRATARLAVPITELQKKTAQAIVNIFETSHIRGDYGMITLLAGDSGHLTYGRSQTTLASGNLFLLVKAYREATEAQFAEPLQPFLGRLSQRDLTLDLDLDFRRI